MEKIFKFVFCIFSNWRKCLAGKRGIILKFQAEIRGVLLTPNRLQALVKLFQIIFPFQTQRRFGEIKDLKKRNYGQIDELVASLEALQKVIDEIWKNPINQTISGKTPDQHSIYISKGLMGFSRLPVSYFLKHEERLKKEIVPAAEKDLELGVENQWQAINKHADELVRLFADQLLKELGVVKRWL